MTEQYKAFAGTDTYSMGYLKPFTVGALENREDRIGSCMIRRVDKEESTTHWCSHHGQIEVIWNDDEPTP